uniref:F-box domain-containing protein n=1 Tax=Mycena chlorophos TaxID=658473 RepID=A0ABQ0LU25_MYCCL|nr:predicted protein [Mycena chlorophos]
MPLTKLARNGAASHMPSVSTNLLMSRNLIVLGIAAALFLQTKPWSRPTQRTPSVQLEESPPPEMLPRPTPELPTEIWMLIFDFSDTRTLAAVSATCRLLHAISMSALVSHLVWRSPERAREHLSTFWVRFQNNGHSVSSLTIKFTPFLRSETVIFDIYADIFQAMSVFRYGLRRLVICGTALPDNFFEFLDSLPSLQDLNLRQCIVPPSPAHLRTPLHLQKLSLVDLSPRCVGVYSAYFVHLFPSVTNVSIDHGPHAHGCSKLSVPTIQCAPKRITLGPAVDDVSCLQYMTALSLFRLHELEALVVIITELHYPPFICCDRFPMKDIPRLTQLRHLETLVAPPHVVELLARATSGLRRVAIQGTRVKWTSRVLDALEKHRDSMEELAIHLQSWNDSVVPYIAERLPLLRSLEILYHEEGPSEQSLKILGQEHLIGLCKLATLRIHPFPRGHYGGVSRSPFQFSSAFASRSWVATPASRLQTARCRNGFAALL